MNEHISTNHTNLKKKRLSSSTYGSERKNTLTQVSYILVVPICKLTLANLLLKKKKKWRELLMKFQIINLQQFERVS